MKTNDTPSRFKLLARTALYGAVLAGGLTLGSPAQANLAFTYNYSGAFLDVTDGAARQQAMTDAGNLSSSMFGTYSSNSATLNIDVSGSNDPAASTLASAGSDFMFVPGFGGGEVIRNKLQSNGAIDLNGAAADGSVDVNFGNDWQLDPNAVVQSGQYDFFAALFHELTHALGFSSSITQAGDDGFGGGLIDPGSWSKFDQFMTNCSGADLVNHATGEINQGVYDGAKTSAMCFAGPNAMAAYSGNPVDLYAPNPYSTGSSGSHLNTDDPNFATSMMKHDRGEGPEARDYSPVEIGILEDIGYTRVATTAVPEPGTMALLLTAGVLGMVARRRKA